MPACPRNKYGPALQGSPNHSAITWTWQPLRCRGLASKARTHERNGPISQPPIRTGAKKNLEENDSREGRSIAAANDSVEVKAKGGQGLVFDQPLGVHPTSCAMISLGRDQGLDPLQPRFRLLKAVIGRSSQRIIGVIPNGPCFREHFKLTARKVKPDREVSVFCCAEIFVEANLPRQFPGHNHCTGLCKAPIAEKIAGHVFIRQYGAWGFQECEAVTTIDPDARITRDAPCSVE